VHEYPVALIGGDGAVAGKLLPFNEYPMTPLSLRTSGSSWLSRRSAGIASPPIVWPRGRAMSPTKSVPSNPFGTCI